jgi:D-amino peptidase
MKILILADLEGVSGADDYRLLIPAGPIYQQACENLTEDINAAVRGLRAAGATEIDLVDSHSTVWPTRTGPRNIVKDRIDPGIGRMMGGWDMLMLTRARGDPLRSYDAQVIVGEHAMAGTPDGFASHTHSDNTALRINGQYVGEVEWHTWLLGYYGVPTIMITGDAAAIREAKVFFPEIEGVSVKTATSRDRARYLPVAEARRLIEETAAKALVRLEQFEAHVPQSPIKLDVVFTAADSARFGSYMPGARLVDDRTVSYTAADYLELVWAHMSLVMLGALHVFGGDFDKLWKLSPEDARKQFNRDYEERVDGWMKEPSPFSSADLGRRGE